MKGGLTAAIWAARALVESGIELKNDLIVEAVMGEEQACDNYSSDDELDRTYDRLL